MPRKSNKTAHVLGLITNNKGEDSPSEQIIEKMIPVPENIAKKSEANVQVTSQDNSAQLSDTIKKKLIKEIKKSGGMLPPEPELNTEPEGLRPAAETPEEKAPASEATDTEALPGPFEMSAGYDSFARYNESEYCYINVIESVVKERILEFMEKFDMCTCDRCIMDTIALCLSSMNPKYVVAKKGDCFPLLNYYSSRFSADIVSALTKACMKVSESPHHDVRSEL